MTVSPHVASTGCTLSYFWIRLHEKLIFWAFQLQSPVDPAICDLAEKVCRSEGRWGWQLTHFILPHSPGTHVPVVCESVEVDHVGSPDGRASAQEP